MAYVRDSSEDLVWDSGSGQYVPATQQFTFTVTPSPIGATVTITDGVNTATGTGTQSLVVDDGSNVNWTVSLAGYATQSGSSVVDGDDIDLSITLLEMFTFEVTPTPADATVTLTATGYYQTNNTITVPDGTTVTYSVTKTGYTPVNNQQVTVTQNDTVQVNLTIIQCTVTVTSTPNTSTILLQASGYTDVTGASPQSITVDYGTAVSYTVSASGYITQTYTYSSVTDDIPVTVNLSREHVTLRVIPTPSDATVTITDGTNTQTGTGTQLLEVNYGANVDWSVTKTGYQSDSGTISNIQANQDLPVEIFELYTLTVNPTPVDATVVLSATGFSQVGNQITVTRGSSVTWTVSKSGYTTRTDTLTVNASQTLNITLITTYCTLTIVPTPSDATVVLTASGATQSGNTITVLNGTTVTYTVSKTNYVTQTNSLALTYDRTLNIDLLGVYTYTVSPIPVDATVKLEAPGYATVQGTGTQSISIASGTEVTWTVSKTGYNQRMGSRVIIADYTESIAIPSSSTTMDDLNIVPAGSPRTTYGNTEIRTDVIELMQKKIDSFQGISEQGKILAVDADGFVKLSQGVPGLVLEWGQIGGVLSDQVDLQNALNLKANDNDVVHRENNIAESITGAKTFKGTIFCQDTGMDETTTPTNVRIKDIVVTDTNNIQLARFGFRQEVDNRHSTEVVTQKTIGSGFYKAFFKNNIDTSGNGWVEYDVNVDGTGTATNLSLTKNSVTSIDKTIPTMGWCNNDTGINNLVHKTGNETIGGVKTFTSGISGTATSALWADLAEQYVTDEKYPVGTLIKFGGEKDITIADDEVNGVISDKPGFLLDYKLEDSLPVALVGKTPVRIIGKVNKFDKITLSEIPGVGKVAKEGERVIARALESSDNEEEKLVNCVTKFTL